MDKQTRLHELLRDVVEWGDEVASIIEGVKRDDFITHRLVRLSVWKCIENVGEAAARILRLFPDFADKHPELELNEARAMRNQLTHGYDGVDFELVWVTANRSVPPMVQAARTYLQAHAADDSP
ncbi:DUF86 domain-containing protein [Tianweitania sp.]|uniref:HepT-like ribonuclease domain-containing protein n=1 Tax=Tianweitania sp. TaxID=2021634 RepID=UPI00289C7A44|nr:HepT-like ribonuclease domain-containing protein [Tianweitania sp.]